LIPSTFRIGMVQGTQHKAEFAIVETRLVVSWLTLDTWDNFQELGVTICKFTFSVKDGIFRQRWTPLVNVSLHALARRIERSRLRDHVAIFHDIALLASVNAADRTPTRDGFWLSSLIDARDAQKRVMPIRSVRTWIDG
jgi:hypothetical protein